MGTGDRLLLLVLSIILVSIAAGTVLLGFNLGPATSTMALLFKRFVYGRLEAVLIGGVVIVFALRLIYLSLAGRRQPGVLVARSELGEVSITLPAVENLVKRSVGQVDGVREVRPIVRAQTDGVTVKLKAWVEKDFNVPELAVQIQETLRSHLKEVVGLNATTINVEVQDIGSEQTFKPRPNR
ncbi:MAG: alkaline shock response membrane anchor protein AmaP [bacterium]